MIRTAEPADLATVTELLRAAGLPLDGVAASLGSFVVAESQGSVVATGGLEVAGRDALLRSVAVRASHRGRGFGERITAALIARARDRELETIWLLTETAADFFPRFGFRRVDRDQAPGGLQATAEFTHCCPASAVAMARRATPLRVLVLCTANSARSQLAEAILRHCGGDLVQAASAGTAPGAGPHPLAVEALRLRGIEWSGRHSKSIDEVGSGWDLVITVCDDARESCPVLPGHATAHWSYPDPAAGDEARRLAAFVAVADDLERRIRRLLDLPLAVMTPGEIAARL